MPEEKKVKYLYAMDNNKEIHMVLKYVHMFQNLLSFSQL